MLQPNLETVPGLPRVRPGQIPGSLLPPQAFMALHPEVTTKIRVMLGR